MSRLFWVIAVVLVLSLLLFLALRNYRQKEVSPPIIQKQEEITEVKGKLIPGFPDFPAYPGVSVKRSYVKNIENGKGYSVEWTTSDSVEEITSWYQDRLAEDGWSFVSQPEENAEVEQFFIVEKQNLLAHVNIERLHDGEASNETEIVVDIQKTNP